MTALPLTKVSLNDCCSTETTECILLGFKDSYVCPTFHAYLADIPTANTNKKSKKKKNRRKRLQGSS